MKRGMRQVYRDYTREDGGPAIQDDDLILDHIPDGPQSRALLAEMAREKFWPNVWRVNERGNVDLLRLRRRGGAVIVASWV